MVLVRFHDRYRHAVICQHSFIVDPVTRDQLNLMRQCISVKVVEGTRERVQVFEGVCIARKNAGLHSSFTIRKISYGEGVERVFPLYSPSVPGIKVVRRGDVRRAKLYYLRERAGKSARIAEKVESQAARAARLAAKESSTRSTPGDEPQAEEVSAADAENAAAKPKSEE